MKKITSIILSIILMLSLCACGSSAKAEVPHAAASGMALNGVYEAAAEEAIADYGLSPMEAPAAPYPEAEADSVGSEVSEALPEENISEKIIYSGNATVETREFDESLAGLEKLVADCGGFVESSGINGTSYSTMYSGYFSGRSADYTIRVPSQRFKEIMSSLSTLGNVPYSNVYSDNITSHYYDTEARLKVYEAQEERLVELLDMANTVADVIEIERELSEVRYSIESLQTTLKGWDRQVNYSTIYVNLIEVVEYTPDSAPGFGSRLAEAFVNGFETFKDVLLALAEALPTVLLIGLILFAVIKGIKKARRASKKNPEEKKAKRCRKNKKAPAAESAAAETPAEAEPLTETIESENAEE